MLAKIARLFTSGDYRGQQRVTRVLDLTSLLLPRTSIIGAETSVGTILCHTADRVITVEVLRVGGWQRKDMERVTALLRRRDHAGRTLVNVGANIGTTVLNASNSGYFSAFVAIEPEPRNFKLLSANVALNGLDRCKLVNKAAGDIPGRIEFELSAKNFGDHRVVQAGLKDAARPTIEVESQPVDDILDGLGISGNDVGLLWMDVQAYEAQVICGATKLIKNGTPVVMEFSPAELRSAETLTTLLESCEKLFSGFVTLRDGDDTERPIAELRALGSDLGMEHTDVILFPRDAPGELTG